MQASSRRSDVLSFLYLLLLCHRQCSRDPRVYANPEVFSPERFMASEGGVKEADPRDYIFGFGRRCVFPLYLSAS
jgi:cytochrome P450